MNRIDALARWALIGFSLLTAATLIRIALSLATDVG